ncbi:hypothetical protein GV794_11155 [Nocardia cyriacigeorgica]|uniref:Peptidase M14 domain-containing protein n=1 Tax=Nocardia cyriacigeorgica TaxID=135487 RepID=A0ABX0CIY4_9NOCA|nr:M14 family zinc carboxypeptidase [Nocardia cyriacigeorgica]NEW38044.1 hypothetical protein [Nocardia cyriacigeorgica]NEW48573.1 hypothetical protein [Nocardia cyriacigeorgica]NEW56203.1 hypothetical protein [Nocardia cyriacigeorgica]
MDDIGAIVGSVDRIDGFPTVDQLAVFLAELAAARPDRVRLTDIGRSRNGEPIRAARIGTGEPHIIVLGNPHPNEPLGMATIRHLVRRLVEDESAVLGASWHIVPCLDPDGTRLNEAWFGGPMTRTDVARGFYRPPSSQQPEWCFPVAWRGTTIGTPLPETTALMTLIDRTRPALIASLHNADFGGGFFYCSGGDQSYWAALTGLLEAAQVPVYRGEPDAPGSRAVAPGVFRLPSFSTMAEALAAADADPATVLGGGGSLDYAGRYGTAVLVSELPLWVDARIDDDSPSQQCSAEVLDAVAKAYRELVALIDGAVELCPTPGRAPGPFEQALRAMRTDLTAMAAAKEMGAARAGERIATRGEVFVENYVWIAMMRLRVCGMALRLLGSEVRDGTPAVARERSRFGTLFDRWSGEIEAVAPGVVVPLEHLVRAQAGAIVLAATRVCSGLAV